MQFHKFSVTLLTKSNFIWYGGKRHSFELIQSRMVETGKLMSIHSNLHHKKIKLATMERKRDDQKVVIS